MGQRKCKGGREGSGGMKEGGNGYGLIRYDGREVPMTR